MNVQINITDTRITISGTDRGPMIARLLDFVTSPSSPAIVQNEKAVPTFRSVKILPLVRKTYKKRVDFPERFTRTELEKHLNYPRGVTCHRIEKGLKNGEIEFIGKKPYGEHIFQRRNAKIPMVRTNSSRHSVLLTPAVADEIKERMADMRGTAAASLS